MPASPAIQSWTTPEGRDRLAALVEKAGVEVLARLSHAPYETTWSEEFSPTTEPDHASHEVLVQGLQKVSDLPLVSAASKPPAYATRREWTRHWILDSLGGMRDVVQKADDYTVSIALVDEGRPVLGVVHAPAHATTYWGARDHGARRRREGGQWERVATRTLPEHEPLKVVVGRRPTAAPPLAAYLARLPDHEVLEMGGSLPFCALAEGAADLYPVLKEAWEWDTAAGHAVLAAAGGDVRDLEGRPLSYNGDDMRQPDFVAAADVGWFA